MNKRGFTLVELLAVIAILAILVIIALPNVMGMFNTAKKNSFSNEVREIIKQAKTSVVTDSTFGGSANANGICYSAKMDGDTASTVDGGGKSLDMSGRKISYGVCFNKANQITSFAATDGTFVVASKKLDLQETDIEVAADGSGFSTADNKIYTITDSSGKTGAKLTYDTTNGYGAALTP